MLKIWIRDMQSVQSEELASFREPPRAADEVEKDIFLKICQVIGIKPDKIEARPSAPPSTRKQIALDRERIFPDMRPYLPPGMPDMRFPGGWRSNFGPGLPMDEGRPPMPPGFGLPSDTGLQKRIFDDHPLNLAIVDFRPLDRQDEESIPVGQSKLY